GLVARARGCPTSESAGRNREANLQAHCKYPFHTSSLGVPTLRRTARFLQRSMHRFRVPLEHAGTRRSDVSGQYASAALMCATCRTSFRSGERTTTHDARAEGFERGQAKPSWLWSSRMMLSHSRRLTRTRRMKFCRVALTSASRAADVQPGCWP